MSFYERMTEMLEESHGCESTKLDRIITNWGFLALFVLMVIFPVIARIL